MLTKISMGGHGQDNRNFRHLENLIVLKASGLFIKFGIKSVSMDDVASECGISKKTLYKYFDRERMVAAVVDQLITVYETRLASIQRRALPVVPELQQMLSQSLDSSRQVSGQFLHSLKIFHNDAYRKMLDFISGKVKNVFQANLCKGRNLGLYRPDIQLPVILQLYFHQILDISQQRPIDKSKWITELNRLFLFGILAPKGLAILDDQHTLTGNTLR